MSFDREGILEDFYAPTRGDPPRCFRKRHEFFHEIRRMGFQIVNGKKHYFVLDPVTGARLAVLPRGQHAYGGGRNGIAVLSRLRRYRRQWPMS
jgi:hypothetical protein